MDRTILNKLLLILLIGLVYGQNPFEELVSPTNTSGVFQGQATIDGNPAEEGDWIAAFDEDGNCAGAGELTLWEGLSYINLTIYGDDGTSSGVDEGINAGENFYLRLWDSSSDVVLENGLGFCLLFNSLNLLSIESTKGEPLWNV